MFVNKLLPYKYVKASESSSENLRIFVVKFKKIKSIKSQYVIEFE